jgi:glycosyltransferase involved in cell wall biosynthesis
VACDDEDALSAALQRAIEDSALRARLRSAGLAQAARFTWPAAAAVLWQTYEQTYHAP